MQAHIAMLADAYCNAIECDETSGRAMFWKLQQRVQRAVLDKLEERDDVPASLMWHAGLLEKFVTGMADKAVLDLARRQVAEANATADEAKQAERVDNSPEAAEALMLFSDDASSTVDSVAEEQATSNTGHDANPLVLFGSMEYIREHLSAGGTQVADSNNQSDKELDAQSDKEPESRRCYVVFNMSDGSEERYYGDWHTSCYPDKDTVYFDDGEVHLLPREDIVFVRSKKRNSAGVKARANGVEAKEARKRPRVAFEAPRTQHLCSWGCGKPSDHKGLCNALQESRLRRKAVAAK